MMRWLRKQFMFYFGFSKTEANGSIVLIFLMIVVSFAPWMVRTVRLNRPPDRSYQVLLDSLQQTINSAVKPIPSDSVQPPMEEQLHRFDPHTISFDKLVRFGLSEEVSRRWRKYVSSGGTFANASDISKVYGLKPEEADRLLPYVVITEQEVEAVDEVPLETVVAFDVEEAEKLVPINLNTSDSLELMKVHGIGPVLSARIIRFRKSLGGFSSLDQLDEVYGLEDEALNNIKSRTFIEENYVPKQLNINTLSSDELAKHPYINFSEAKNIVAYRKQHGNFPDVSSLLNIYTLDSAWYVKVSTYLTY